MDIKKEKVDNSIFDNAKNKGKYDAFLDLVRKLKPNEQISIRVKDNTAATVRNKIKEKISKDLYDIVPHNGRLYVRLNPYKESKSNE